MRTRILLALAALGLAAPVSAGAAGVTVDTASTRMICRVTGEDSANRTESRFRFWGTDLGASLEHDGKAVFLFGDTHAAAGLNRAPDRDLVAVSADRDPEDCLTLDVLTDDDGGYRPLSVAGVEGGPFSVPTGGFSAKGAMYVGLTTDRTDTRPMGRSVLARSTDGGRNFQPLFDLSTRHFITNAFVPDGDGALFWGSGDYRASDVRLARLADPDDKTSLRFFAGLDGGGQPLWSPREDDARPLFHQSCVGELSVAWNADLAKWVMLYNCGAPESRILARTADKPWGPWSEPQLVFAAEQGFGRFIHRADSDDQLSDPHSPQVSGDPYAPYMIARFAKGVPGQYADIRFLMSTWNPYNTVLMTTRLRLAPDGPSA